MVSEETGVGFECLILLNLLFAVPHCCRILLLQFHTVVEYLHCSRISVSVSFKDSYCRVWNLCSRGNNRVFFKESAIH